MKIFLASGDYDDGLYPRPRQGFATTRYYTQQDADASSPAWIGKRAARNGGKNRTKSDIEIVNFFRENALKLTHMLSKKISGEPIKRGRGGKKRNKDHRMETRGVPVTAEGLQRERSRQEERRMKRRGQED